MEESKDIFIRYVKYPNVNNVFSTSIPSIDPIKDDCLVVLDTNVLLQPYEGQSKALTGIKKVLETLIKANKLIIPGQVVREFIDNRDEKLKNISGQFNLHFQMLENEKKGLFKEINFERSKFPLLAEDTEFQDLATIEEDLNEEGNKVRQELEKLIKAYRTKFDEYFKAFKNFNDKVRSWNWRDPVSSMYADLFTSEIIVDFDFTQKSQSEVEKELDNRYFHKIPPGYKDGGTRKPDKGIGDYLIWLTILQIAKERQKNIVFVSGDQKSDWFIRKDKQPLYPRFELINEFRNNAPDCLFSIELLYYDIQLVRQKFHKPAQIPATRL